MTPAGLRSQDARGFVPVPQATREVDDLVLVRARGGDQAAFADVVRHYDHRLRSLAFRLLVDRDRMDDVLQEVYVKAFRSLPRIKGTSALGTWLYRITCNACLDDLRGRPGTAPVTYDADRGASIADSAPGPAEITVDRNDMAAALGPPAPRPAGRRPAGGRLRSGLHRCR